MKSVQHGSRSWTVLWLVFGTILATAWNLQVFEVPDEMQVHRISPISSGTSPATASGKSITVDADPRVKPNNETGAHASKEQADRGNLVDPGKIHPFETVDPNSPPVVLAIYPFNGSTVSTEGGVVRLTVVYDDVESSIKTVKLYDASGNDWSDKATITHHSLELDLSHAKHGSHQYTISLEDDQGAKTDANLSFDVDAVIPVTIASPGSGLYGPNPVTVTLTQSEPGTLYYSTNGYPPIKGSAHTQKATETTVSLTFSEDTVLHFFAEDVAGNQEPIRKYVYRFGPYVAYNRSSFCTVKKSKEMIQCYWKVQGNFEGVPSPDEDVELRLYRAVSEENRALLEQSRTDQHPPAQSLEVARFPALGGPITVPLHAPGTTAWFGFTEVRDGMESGISALRSLVAPKDVPTKSIEEARAHSIAWLQSKQNKDGSWGKGGALRSLTTAQALNGLVAAGIGDLAVRKGLLYLRGAPLHSTQALARAIIALARSGYNVDAFVTRLLARASILKGHFQGFASHPRYRMDVFHTALGLMAMRRASQVHGEYAYIQKRLRQHLKDSQGFSWVQDGPQHTYVSAAGLHAIGASTDKYAWIADHQFDAPGSLADGTFGPTMDTAAVLRWVPLTSAKKSKARQFLVRLQKLGSWEGDIALTGFCLAALHDRPLDPPTVQTGYHLTVKMPAKGPARAELHAHVQPGQLQGSTVSVTWHKIQGPGAVGFTNPSAAVTKATFSKPGRYRLQVTGQEGLLSSMGRVDVTVLPKNTTSFPVDKRFSIPSGTGVPIQLSSGLTKKGLAGTGILDVGLKWVLLQGPAHGVTGLNETATVSLQFPMTGQYQLALVNKDQPTVLYKNIAVNVTPPANMKMPLEVQTNVPGLAFVRKKKTIIPLEAIVVAKNLSSVPRVTWSLVSKPKTKIKNKLIESVARVTIKNPNQPSTRATLTNVHGPTQFGTYVFRVKASLGTTTVEKTVHVQVMKPGLDPSNMVFHWDFEEGSMDGNRVLDRSGNENHGTVHNGANLVTTLDGKALYLNGIDQYIDLDLEDFQTQAYTISFWIKPSISSRSNESLLEWTNHAVAPSLRTYGTEFIAHRGTGGIMSTSQYRAHKWTHIALVFIDAYITQDGRNSPPAWLIFVDGVRRQSHGAKTLMSAKAAGSVLQHFRIGKGTPGKTHYFRGLIDDIRVYTFGIGGGTPTNPSSKTSHPVWALYKDSSYSPEQ